MASQSWEISMPQPTVVVAGTGFTALRQYMNEQLPGVRLEMVAPADLRKNGFAADVLIPAMARIDGEMMDRIEGLRLIQQWGVGLEGVDIEAATRRRIAVARVPSAGTGNAESCAEWCVMAAIAVSRHLPAAEQTIRAGTGWGTPRGRAMLGRTAGIIGLGGEVAWPRPTRAGDTLRLESEIADISPSRSKPNQGIVTVRSTMFNQNREPVYLFTAKVLVFRRPSI